MDKSTNGEDEPLHEAELLHRVSIYRADGGH
jgi:hypothetical protein